MWNNFDPSERRDFANYLNSVARDVQRAAITSPGSVWVNGHRLSVEEKRSGAGVIEYVAVIEANAANGNTPGNAEFVRLRSEPKATAALAWQYVRRAFVVFDLQNNAPAVIHV